MYPLTPTDLLLVVFSRGSYLPNYDFRKSTRLVVSLILPLRPLQCSTFHLLLIIAVPVVDLYEAPIH